ncbi:cytochrome b/b6 domain-containing protein [Spirillospora sp. NPDC048819]|uniref:cytochrome b/b6 domain-containing protein n=1 Tax=Spirillospora sp. NPDC048819 TaxID=3155268 RepID=UPI0033F7753B
MAIEPAEKPVRLGTVERYSRPARWFHAGVYLAVLVLLGTGWWLLLGREGDPSPVSRLLRTPDTTVHKYVGWALAALIVVGLVLGMRAVRTFVMESLRFRAGDARWFLTWPSAVLTGRFARHDGHFDPGQRMVNVLLVAGLFVLVGSGVGLVLLHGGPTFAVLARLHKWSTYFCTVLIAGHVLIAAGVLPGYRGVWRSMHLGGRLDARVAGRLWPGWLDRVRDDRREPR